MWIVTIFWGKKRRVQILAHEIVEFYLYEKINFTGNRDSAQNVSQYEKTTL